MCSVIVLLCIVFAIIGVIGLGFAIVWFVDLVLGEVEL
jgi:hypothetical protein